MGQFYRTGTTRGIQSKHVKRLRMQLAVLDSAQSVDDVDLPGYRLHPLIGQLSGLWSVTVNTNWRLTFEFNDGHVYKVNYEDYH